MRKAVAWLLCGMAFCIPWEEQAVLPGSQTAIFSLGVVVLVLAIFALLRRKVHPPPLALPVLALFVLRSYFSALWADDAHSAIMGSVTMTGLLLFTAMLWEFGRERDRALLVMRAYLLGCCVSLATMIAAYLWGWRPVGATEIRFQGGGLNENDIATVLDIAIPMAVFLADRPAGRRLERILCWAFVPAAVLGVFLTGSRAGIVALTAGMLLLAFPMAFKRPKTVFALVLVLGATGVMVPRLVPESIFARLAEGTHADTFQIRMRLWSAGLEYFGEHPWLGCGTWNFKRTVASRVAEQYVAHNTFISLLAEGGVVGFLMMLLFWGLLARMTTRLPRGEMVFWLTVFSVWAVCVMTLSWDTNKSTWLIYGLLMARHSQARAPKAAAA